MKKIIAFLFLAFSLFIHSSNLKIRLVHKPEIKSRFDKIVIVPTQNTPFEFTGYIEEQIKKTTNIEVLNKEDFSNFLKKEGIGKRKITAEDLIKIYKAFGDILIVFLDLQNLNVKNTLLNNKTPCKRGEISFSFSIFHSRDGLLVNNKKIDLLATVCSKTPIYPETSTVVKLLFDNSVVEIVKPFSSWKEDILIPKKAFSNFDKAKIENLLKKREYKTLIKILKKKNCKEKCPMQFNLLIAVTKLLKGKIKESKKDLSKILSLTNDTEVTNFITAVKSINEKTVAAIGLIDKNLSKKQEKLSECPNIKQQYYTDQYKNSADILLEKLSNLEKLYKAGKISKEKYLNEKYKLINQF